MPTVPAGPQNGTASLEREAQLQRLSLRLGLRSGLLTGLALALGTWTPHIMALRATHLRLIYPPLIIGSLALLLLGGLGGWLAARFRNALAGGLAWAVVGVFMALVIGHVPFDGQNLVVWIADRRFWGLSVYPFGDTAQYHVWLSGFFIVLLLAVLGLFQDYRLEGLRADVDDKGRLEASVWLTIALPLPLVLAVGLITDNIVNSPLRTAPRQVHQAIHTGRTFAGDLFELSLERGLNYNAIAGVRDLMSENYSLLIGKANLGASDSVYVVAHFDNGAWIGCWVVADALSNCYDASPPYTQGLAALLTSGEIPPDCPECSVRVSDEQRTWLASRSVDFAGAPQITRLAQWGTFVLVRAQALASSAEPSSSSDYAIECRFYDVDPVRLEDCWEVEGSSKAGSVREPPHPVGEITPSPSPRPTTTDSPSLDSQLAPYASAMRPAFVDDLSAIGPVSRYRIEVAVDPERATLSGQETVHYVNTAAVSQDAVYLRLFPNLPGYGGEMSVSNLQVRDAAVTGSLEVQETALRVPLTEPLLPGEETVITLDFDVTVPITVGEGYGQFVYLQDVMALANFFPLIPAFDEENCARFGNCAAGWNVEYAVPYGDAVYSDTALFEILVTAPTGWTVVASGSTVSQKAAPQDMATWRVVSGPMRDVNVVLSPRFELATQRVGDVVVNSYYLPEDAPGGKRVLRWAADALAFFEQHFGPYPFAELDVVATPTVAGGIEYPGLIAMPIRRYDQEEGGRFQWSTIHEVGHQWWYSLVGNDQQDEPWLDEALVQYSTALYYELAIGWDGAVKEVFEASYQQIAGTDEDDLISRPVAAYADSNYGSVVYMKGPLFFHALRQEVGDDAFWAILQTYFDAYRYKTASGADFRALAEEVSRQDLSDLYQEWLGHLDDDG